MKRKMFIAVVSVVLLASCASQRPTLKEKRDQAIARAMETAKGFSCRKIVVIQKDGRVILKNDFYDRQRNN